MTARLRSLALSPLRIRGCRPVMRIASIDNISAEAFGLLSPEFPADVVPMSPAKTFKAIESGRYDAALLPTACLPLLRREVEALGAFGIACTGPVSSVRLYCKKPLERILRSGAPLYVSAKSQTSRRLLSVLCEMEYGQSPTLTPDPSEAVGRLYIGEDVYTVNAEERSWPVAIDMGAWWCAKTGLPFVFAIWVARRDLSSENRENIIGWLRANVEQAESQKGRRLLGRKRLGAMTSRAFAMDYYTRIRARLTPADFDGMRYFLSLTEEQLQCGLSA